MPSPLGHALGGLAAGWLIAGAPTSPDDRQRTTPWTSTWRGALIFAAIAMAPDLDFLIGSHRTYTHSIGAAFIVMLAAMILTRASASSSRTTAGLTCGVAYASHLLLDWLGSDASPPIGLMAAWPFTSNYYESSFHIFMSTTRRYSLPGFWRQNFWAVTYEVGILLPIAAAIYVLRMRRRKPEASATRTTNGRAARERGILPRTTALYALRRRRRKR